MKVKTIAAVLLSSSLTLTAGLSLAADSMVKDSMAKESMKK